MKKLVWIILLVALYGLISSISHGEEGAPDLQNKLLKVLTDNKSLITALAEEGKIVVVDNELVVDINGITYIVGNMTDVEQEIVNELWKVRKAKREIQVAGELGRKQDRDIEQIKANAMRDYLIANSIPLREIASALSNGSGVTNLYNRNSNNSSSNSNSRATGGAGGKGGNSNSSSTSRVGDITSTGGNSSSTSRVGDITNTNDNNNINRNDNTNTNKNDNSIVNDIQNRINNNTNVDVNVENTNTNEDGNCDDPKDPDKPNKPKKDKKPKNNRGWGNGGDSEGEGDNEQDNPGNGNGGNGKGNN